MENSMTDTKLQDTKLQDAIDAYAMERREAWRPRLTLFLLLGLPMIIFGGSLGIAAAIIVQLGVEVMVQRELSRLKGAILALDPSGYSLRHWRESSSFS